jgi:hypothetical protein
MFATHFAESIANASLSGCDEVPRTLWKAYTARAETCRPWLRERSALSPAMGCSASRLRPRPGRKNLTNIVRITDPAWRSLDRVTKSTPTAKGYQNSSDDDASDPFG